MLRVSDLFTHLSPVQFSGDRDTLACSVNSVTANSRAVEAGDLFVAIPGGRFDGHRFLVDAVQRGAVAAVGTVSTGDLASLGIHLPVDFPYAQVSNSRLALAVACAALQGFPSDWEFIGSIAARFRQIGNAVQGHIGRAIAAKLYEAAQEKCAARPTSAPWPPSFHKRVRYTAMEEVVNGAHRRAARGLGSDGVATAMER